MAIDKKYKFGETVFRILAPADLRWDERFEAFAYIGESEDYTYEILPLKEHMSMGREVFLTKRNDRHIRVYMKMEYLSGITIANLFSAACAANLLPEQDAFVLHASYVLYKGKAILFCAPSGTGKSTQARFWEQRFGTLTVNEDRVIITKKDGVYHAYGCWATGKSCTCQNVTAPISAVVLLGQGQKNRVEKIAPIEALQHLLRQSSFDAGNEKQCEKMFSVLLDVIETTKILSYSCVNDISSAEELEKHI